MHSTNLIYPFLIMLAAALWGLDAVLLTPQLSQYSVLLVVFSIHLIPAVGFTLTLFISPQLKQEFKAIKPSNLCIISLMALLGGVAGTLCIIKALFLVNFNGLSIVALLQKLQPIWAILLAYLLLKERMHKSYWLFFISAIIASYFLTFGWGLPDWDTDLPLEMASLWAITASFCYASATVLGKKVTGFVHFKTIVMLRYIVVAITTGLWLAIDYQINQVISIQWASWGIIITINIISGVFALIIYYFALKRVPASIATLCELMFPITVVLLDGILYKHWLSPVQLIATLALFFIIYKVSSKENCH